MERPHYRRVVNGKPKPVNFEVSPKKSFSERLLTQLTICGMIMAVILIINLVDNSNKLSDAIRNAIVAQPTAEDVKGVWNDISGTVDSFVSMLRPSEQTLNSYDIVQGLEKGDDNADALYDLSRDDFRIDEDILRTIQNETVKEQTLEAGASQ
ncbi:MAG: hypothetical protein LBL96_08725 [Clostridiales bacterium]|jgi:hypothetical protein|nr:hypothetical protein [Clostridiales bacterium]